MQTKNYLQKTLALVMAFLMIVTMMPVNVFAENGLEISPQETPQALGAANQFPNNIKKKVDWDQKKDAATYWGLNQEYGVEPFQRIAKVGTSDPINMFDLDYEGYFVNAEGRTVLRLVYREQEKGASSWWHDVAFRFEPDLYEKIDFDKSEAYGTDSDSLKERTGKFYHRNGPNEKGLNIKSLIRLRFGYKVNIPINLVLKDGVKYSDLKKNYLVQMRYVRLPAGNRTVEDIYAFAPGKSTIGYTSYTRATVIPAAGNIDNEFMRGPQHDGSGNDGWIIPSNRAFMNQYFENPGERDAKYKKYDNLGIVSAEYQFIHGNIDGVNSLDEKPLGFMIAFDARLVPYLTKDPTVADTDQSQEIIAYTHLLNDNRKPTNSNSQAIKREHINYSNDKKTAYIVIGEGNFVKDGVNVVTVGKLSDYIINGRSNITTIDFFVDKAKFKNTFQSTGKNDERFNIMAGFVEPNTTGMTIFEKTYVDGLTIPNRSDLYVDTGNTPQGNFIFVQAGSDQDTFLKRPQGYYVGLETASNTTAPDRDTFEKIDDGYYRVPFRDGTKLEANGKMIVYMPDTSNHTQGVSARVVSNAIENSATIKYRKDKDIDINIEPVEGKDTIYELVYTPKGENNTTTIKITRTSSWSHDDRKKLFKVFKPVLGNIVIDTSKMDPNKGLSIKTTKKDGTVLESYVSDKFIFDKSQEKFEGLVFTDNSESLGSILVNKSMFTPYARIFTNDYVDSNQKDVYDAYDIKPINKDSFMTNTASIKAYSSYEGSPVTMRYIPIEGDVFYQTVNSIENPEDKDGFEIEDKSRAIRVPKSERDPVNNKIKTYNKYEFEMPLNKFIKVTGPDSELSNQTLILKKDMRLLINNTKASSLPSDWYETRVRTRVLFDTNNDFNWTVEPNSVDSIVKIVPDNKRYASDKDYKANGFSEESGAQKLEKKYTQNIIKENGEIEQVEAELSDEELALRQWPENPKPFTKDGKTYKFLGWATKEVTAEEFAKLDTLTNVSQWETAATTGYKVTAKTPFDSHQVVYGVWDEGFKIILHANNLADGSTETETTYEIVVKPSAFGSDKAEVEIPAVPYWTGDKETTTNDTLQKFVKSTSADPRQTFIGWSADKTGDAVKENIGKNLSVLAEENKVTANEIDPKVAAYNFSTIIKEETTGTSEDQVITRTPTDVMLPNGYKLVLPGTYDDWLKKDHIHLYAQYRPFFNVNVEKQYKFIQGEDGPKPSYVETLNGKSISYKPEVKVGLLFRTAVTNFKDPTVHKAANYYTIDQGKYALTDKGIEGYKLQKVSDGGTVKFTVPGYDTLGQRLSYSAVETKDGEESKYYDFKNDWSSLGITIYTRIPGKGQAAINEGPIDPADNDRREAKIQSITIPDSNPDTIDTFTSATTRNSIPTSKTSGEFDLKGYDITMYNVPREVPTPIFETVYDGDTSFKLKADGLGLAVVDSVELKLPGSDKFVRFIYYNNEGVWKQVKPNPNPTESSEKWTPETDNSKLIGDITVEGTGADKKLKFTSKTGAAAFKENDKIYAKYWKAALDGQVGETTVVALPTNVPVQKVIQERNQYDDDKDPNHQNPKVVISSEIPAGTGGVLYEPPADTTYVLVKADGTSIVDDKGKPIMYEKTAGQQQGTKITFPPFDPKTNGLNHKDKVYIKTTLPPKDGRTFDSVTSTAFAPLIIGGPIKGIKYEDDIFRRWMDVTVTMEDGDYPVEDNFTVKITFTDGSADKEIKNISSSRELKQILSELYRVDNIDMIYVTGEDKFGNKNTGEKKYMEPKQIVVKIVNPRVGAKLVRVIGPAGAEITLTITKVSGGEPIVKKITTTDNKPVKIGLDDYKLQEGDTIELYGVTKDDGGNVIGETNPFKMVVR